MRALGFRSSATSLSCFLFCRLVVSFLLHLSASTLFGAMSHFQVGSNFFWSLWCYDYLILFFRVFSVVGEKAETLVILCCRVFFAQAQVCSTVDDGALSRRRCSCSASTPFQTSSQFSSFHRKSSSKTMSVLLEPTHRHSIASASR